MHLILQMLPYAAPLSVRMRGLAARQAALSGRAVRGQSEREERPVSAADYRRLADWRAALRTFSRASQTLLRDNGLTSQQYQTLLILWSADGAMNGGGISLSELARELQVRHTTAVALVNRLAAGGYVARRAHPQDRRRVQLALTGSGERVLRRLVQAHRQALEQIAPALRKIIS